MKIAVTGASGFVGRHTVASLIEQGHAVTVVGRGASKLKAFDWFDAVRVVELDLHALPSDWSAQLGQQDALVHLAWSGLPNYRELFHFERNLPADYAFLKAAVESGIKRVLATGTCFEYGMQSGALSEDMPTLPGNPYALAKDTLRKFLESLRTTQPFSLLWTRLFYMHGAGQNPGSLLAQLDRAIDAGESEFAMSPGEQLRDYLPVGTVASHLSRLVTQDAVSGVLNCCSGTPVSVRSLVEQRMEERGAKLKLQLGRFGYSPLEPMAFWGDSRRLLSALSADRSLPA